MNDSAEIYNYERIFETTTARIRSSGIDENTKSQILRFCNDLQAEGLSRARILKYLNTLHTLSKLVPKPFSESNKDDVMELVRKIESKNYSDWTKRDFKIIIKRFFKWLKQTEDYPEEVKWIKAKSNKNHTLPEELLTVAEIEKLANAANNPRDKAFILVLYDSGCRIGEILSLRIKNVQFDEFGAQLIVNGKTGQRRVRVIASAPKLAVWIDNHPNRDNPDSPLWVSLGTKNRNERLTYAAAKTVIKEIAVRAQIRKRVYPHLFRHSRATSLANVLTESQLKQMLGWVQSSAMASVYVHLSGRDVDNALLRINGIETAESEREEKFRMVICSRCHQKNSPTSKFCNSCGLPLDTKVALQIDETRAKADRLMNELVKNPEVLDSLLEGIEKLKELVPSSERTGF